ncbi:PREDICTED: regulator of G-protein signaling protein-like [Condylura cristata]|uniref:regulator of G-protein signaling protein-like n=1 Tax=Condylura cristata TaxID=143302 RepID=UPI0003347B16|nr:PREDICTED: regulator of G-protein signaling protein-like [Condylura cristata]
MSNVEIIGSTNLIILLEDEVFADFFNTFLSLPVFGQTPFYTVENSEWSLWPELPYNLVAKYKGLLTWLEKFRLPFFCKTNLCFHYILCQEFISFIKSTEGGEELVDFWILAEKILSIDEMDLNMRDHYLSLLLVLKATHLQEGSRVVTLCNMNIKSLLKLPIWHPNQSTTRREILSHMQKVALFKLQSYWLPNFYTHAKMIMAKEESCQGLMQEYETGLFSVCHTHDGGIPLNMSIKKCQHPQKHYSSRKTKKKMKQLIDHNSWSLEMDLKSNTTIWPPQEACPQEMMSPQMPSLKVTSSKERKNSSQEKDRPGARKSNVKKVKSNIQLEGVFEDNFSAHLRTVTPIINHTTPVTFKRAKKQKFSLGYTHWALCADTCAGSPFRHHLKKQDLKVEIQLLDLWQDLHHFLSVLMRNRKTGNAVFRHMLGNRICELYLNEQICPPLPLKSRTIQGLKELLPSGDVNPWIPRAQKEICKMLHRWYDEFLDEEDYWFLNFTTQTNFIKTKWYGKECIRKEEIILLYKRFEESLELSQGLADMEGMDSMQWQKVATEDLRQGGSLQVELKSPVFLVDIEKMSFEELCYKYPKLAIEKISNDYKIYCEKAPKVDFSVEIIKEPRIISLSSRKLSFGKRGEIKKPSSRPGNMEEIFTNTNHLEFFREFLRERKEETPLLFLIAMHRISTEKNEKAHKSLLESIIRTFFHSKVPPEEMLQCNIPFVKEIAQMRSISITTLFMLQNYVMKSLEERWFKEYQDLFPPQPPEVQHEIKLPLKKPSKMVVSHLHKSQKKWWLKLISFIRSFCKYRKFMSDPSKRQELEDYLRFEVYNNKENYPSSPNVSGRQTTVSTNIRASEYENGEITLVKRRIFGHKIIIVNFLINDIYFFSEMEKFNNLVSSAHVLQVNRAYNENDLILMKSKINIIIKLYLNSELPPKLRVNISESQKDAILAAIAEGHLSRNIFYGTIMYLFPVIMHFWKRFCSWKAIRSYFQYKGKKLKERKGFPKPVYKYPPLSGGDNPILRFTLLRGVEWFRPQHREVIAVQNSSSSNMTLTRNGLCTMQLYPALGRKVSSIKKEK